MSRRARIKVASLVAGALAIAIGFGVHQSLRAGKYRRWYELSCQRALAAVAECVQNIDSDLAKSLNASSESLFVTLAGNIWRQSEVAKSALSALPTSDVSLDKTSLFLAQVGEFSMSLARKASAGGSLSAEERAALASLSSTASSLSVELYNLLYASAGDGYWEGAPSDGDPNVVNLSAGLTNLEESMPESPTLIYDGPYSTHIIKAVPQYVSNAKRVYSEAEARAAAAEFLGVDKNALALSAATENGDGPFTYTYELTAAGIPHYVTITADGGYVAAFFDGCIPGPDVLDCETAVENARQFLSDHGYENMAASYHYSSGGICYVNFAYSDNGVIVYPDLIQVGVARDNGKVCYMMAAGYLSNHRAGRDLNATISESEAAGAASTDLTRQSAGQLCIIPSPGQNEVLCYEFACTDGQGEKYLVYVNAKNKNVENIFKLIEDENGTLVR